jgi:ABC-type thiamine transport system substrate-binding protein
MGVEIKVTTQELRNAAANIRNITERIQNLYARISEEAQKELLFTQWMYPSNTKVALPESYVKAAPVPSLTLPTYSEATDAVMDEVMNILGK